MKRLTKQEEKYAAELEDALKQFSELREQAKNVDSAELLEQRLPCNQRKFKLPLPRLKRHTEKNLIRLSCLTASVMFLNYWEKTEVQSVREHLQKNRSRQQSVKTFKETRAGTVKSVPAR